MAIQVTINDPAKAKAYFEAKMAFTTGPVELERMMKNNEVNVVDVRAAEDYAEGHIPGAINLPKDQWHSLKGLRKDKVNVLYCYSQVCHLAATAAVEFTGKAIPSWNWMVDGAGGGTMTSPSKSDLEVREERKVFIDDRQASDRPRNCSLRTSISTAALHRYGATCRS